MLSEIAVPKKERIVVLLTEMQTNVRLKIISK